VLAILQFDSTSVELLERLLGEGRLPTLAGVRKPGRRYDLDPGSTPLFPSAAYPTLYSGVEIADHAIYSAFPWSPAEQRVRFMRSFPLPRTAWERLPAGRRALVVDPYDNWPPRSGDGVFVSGWQYRNRVAALERWSVPPKAHASLSRRFGAPPLVEDAYGEQPARRLVEARRRLLAAREALEAARIAATGYAAIGDAADEILRTAKEFEAELIVIGARSLGTIGRLVLGSVSTKVMHESDCDVLVVK
jgi:nucleotide-binding universal stress UspA family protein